MSAVVGRYREVAINGIPAAVQRKPYVIRQSLDEEIVGVAALKKELCRQYPNWPVWVVTQAESIVARTYQQKNIQDAIIIYGTAYDELRIKLLERTTSLQRRTHQDNILQWINVVSAEIMDFCVSMLKDLRLSDGKTDEFQKVIRKHLNELIKREREILMSQNQKPVEMTLDQLVTHGANVTSYQSINKEDQMTSFPKIDHGGSQLSSTADIPPTDNSDTSFPTIDEAMFDEQIAKNKEEKPSAFFSRTYQTVKQSVTVMTSVVKTGTEKAVTFFNRTMGFLKEMQILMAVVAAAVIIGSFSMRQLKKSVVFSDTIIFGFIATVFTAAVFCTVKCVDSMKNWFSTTVDTVKEWFSKPIFTVRTPA